MFLILPVLLFDCAGVTDKKKIQQPQQKKSAAWVQDIKANLRMASGYQHCKGAR